MPSWYISIYLTLISKILWINSAALSSLKWMPEWMHRRSSNAPSDLSSINFPAIRWSMRIEIWRRYLYSKWFTRKMLLAIWACCSSSISESEDQYADTFQILRLDTGSLSRLGRVPKRLYWRITSSTISVPRTGNRSRVNFRTTSTWSSRHNRWHMRIWQWQHGLR